MKLLIIVATLGLATFVVLRRRNPELAQRVEGAVKDAASTSPTRRLATSPVACATRPRASSHDRRRRRAREHGPGGMDDIPDEPLDDSKDPGGMAAIPDADPPRRESHDDED